MKKVGIVILAVLIILGLLFGICYKSMFTKVSKNNTEIEVTIPLGTGTGEIANILKDNKIIRSKIGFKIYVKIHSINNFQAGKYYLKQSMSLKEITQMLQSGIMYDPNETTITYLEGKNMRWLAAKIAEITNNTEYTNRLLDVSNNTIVFDLLNEEKRKELE